MFYFQVIKINNYELKLRDEAYSIAKVNGWHEGNLDLAGLLDCDLSHAKAVSERNLLMIKDDFPKFAYRMCRLLTSEDESLKERLNYCIACIIVYCNQNGIEIEWFIKQKMKYNRLREYKHGNKKY